MIVPVFGMHRSGTSALAGLLHQNGIVMGRDVDFYPPPMKENPKGFYENVRFRRLNDAMLNACGYKVKSFSTDLPKVRVVPTPVIEKMRELVQGYSQEFPVWGWKDPRSCLNAAAWLYVLLDFGLLADTRPIVIVRPSEEVRASMLRRGNKEHEGEGQFARLADVYFEAMLKSISFFNAAHQSVLRPPCIITFKELVYHTGATCEKLSQYLGMTIKNNGHIDPAVTAKGV